MVQTEISRRGSCQPLVEGAHQGEADIQGLLWLATSLPFMAFDIIKMNYSL